MKRRDFLKASMAMAATTSGGLLLPSLFNTAHATPGIPLQKTLVHTMLQGGIDFRYVFMPAPSYDANYISKIWNARKDIYRDSNNAAYPDYNAMFSNEYIIVTTATTGDFGIHKSCTWLVEEFNRGNVAIVANVFNNANRQHDHGQLVVMSGDLQTERFKSNRSGWGGRLVESLQGSANINTLNNSVLVFGQSSNASDRLSHIFHSPDLKAAALPLESQYPSGSGWLNDNKQALIRANRFYYNQRGIKEENKSVERQRYKKLFDHHKKYRTLGVDVVDQLSGVTNPLDGLTLNSGNYASQCRNLYYSMFVNHLLDTRVVSMSYEGWDHHKSLQNAINNNLEDVFGLQGGLAAATGAFANEYPEANPQMVYAFSSDFGRQLVVNGSRGTDHGNGTYSVIMGEQVNGGVFGELFPITESIPDANNVIALDRPGSDIAGLTSYERVMREVCNWVEDGVGNVVFPDVTNEPVESGVNLASLFNVVP